MTYSKPRNPVLGDAAGDHSVLHESVNRLTASMLPPL